MWKLKCQYFGHLMRRTDSLEKTLMLEKIEGGRRRDDRGWDGWMASPTWWTWVWASLVSWWWTGKPGVLQAMGSQRVRHDWEAELCWEKIYSAPLKVKVKVLVAESHLILCWPMDCSLTGSCAHGIFQARILEWVAMPSSRGSSRPRDRTWASCTADKFFTIWATRGSL